MEPRMYTLLVVSGLGRKTLTEIQVLESSGDKADEQLDAKSIGQEY